MPEIPGIVELIDFILTEQMNMLNTRNIRT